MNALSERYGADFRAEGKDRAAWLARKASVAGTEPLQVSILGPTVLAQGNQAIVRFGQVYRSELKSDYGVKTLWLEREDGSYRIVDEAWEAQAPTSEAQALLGAPLPVAEMARAAPAHEPTGGLSGARASISASFLVRSDAGAEDCRHGGSRHPRRPGRTWLAAPVRPPPSPRAGPGRGLRRRPRSGAGARRAARGDCPGRARRGAGEAGPPGRPLRAHGRARGRRGAGQLPPGAHGRDVAAGQRPRVRAGEDAIRRRHAGAGVAARDAPRGRRAGLLRVRRLVRGAPLQAGRGGACRRRRPTPRSRARACWSTTPPDAVSSARTSGPGDARTGDRWRGVHRCARRARIARARRRGRRARRLLDRHRGAARLARRSAHDRARRPARGRGPRSGARGGRARARTWAPSPRSRARSRTPCPRTTSTRPERCGCSKPAAGTTCAASRWRPRARSTAKRPSPEASTRACLRGPASPYAASKLATESYALAWSAPWASRRSRCATSTCSARCRTRTGRTPRSSRASSPGRSGRAARRPRRRHADARLHVRRQRGRGEPTGDRLPCREAARRSTSRAARRPVCSSSPSASASSTGRRSRSSTCPRPGDVRHSLGDVSKAARILGWQPRVGLDEGLRLTYASYASGSFQRTAAGAPPAGG